MSVAKLKIELNRAEWIDNLKVHIEMKWVGCKEELFEKLREQSTFDEREIREIVRDAINSLDTMQMAIFERSEGEWKRLSMNQLAIHAAIMMRNGVALREIRAKLHLRTGKSPLTIRQTVIPAAYDLLSPDELEEYSRIKLGDSIRKERARDKVKLEERNKMRAEARALSKNAEIINRRMRKNAGNSTII
jgi:hypothetical protein